MFQDSILKFYLHNIQKCPNKLCANKARQFRIWGATELDSILILTFVSKILIPFWSKRNQSIIHLGLVSYKTILVVVAFSVCAPLPTAASQSTSRAPTLTDKEPTRILA